MTVWLRRYGQGRYERSQGRCGPEYDSQRVKESRLIKWPCGWMSLTQSSGFERRKVSGTAGYPVSLQVQWEVGSKKNGKMKSDRGRQWVLALGLHRQTHKHRSLYNGTSGYDFLWWLSLQLMILFICFLDLFSSYMS